MSKRTFLFLFAVLLVSTLSKAQKADTVLYQLTYDPSSTNVRVTIIPPESLLNTVLTIPRSAPGTYEMTDYALYYHDVVGIADDNQEILAERGIGSYYSFPDNKKKIKSTSYSVNIQRMESELYGSFASSKRRENYLGLFGYSVFGVLSAFQENPIKLSVQAEDNWPIFSTLEPSANRKTGNATYQAANFGILADAQYLLGSDLQIWSNTEGPAPLFVATYAETEVDMNEIGRRALISLNGLNDYFGFTPMPFYTVCYEFVKPYSKQHDYGFSMEHLNSMTASLDTSAAVKKFEENPRMGSMVHHMGHSWIPLRSYGKGYRPFNWETAPIIETIWLNEGFTWFIAYHEVLEFKPILARFNGIMDEAPTYIQEMTLKDLSILGSTQYSADFRIGQNLFARGALLAAEMDRAIRSQSNNQRSFKEAVLGLYHWSQDNKRAFPYDEIPKIMSEAVNMDLSDIWDKWQKAPKMSRHKN